MEKKPHKKSLIATHDLWAEELPRTNCLRLVNCSEAGLEVLPEAFRFGSVKEVEANRTFSPSISL